MLCVHSSYGSLRQLALDSLGNIAEKVSTFYKGCKSWTWFITICYLNLHIWGLYNLFCFCLWKCSTIMKMKHFLELFLWFGSVLSEIFHAVFSCLLQFVLTTDDHSHLVLQLLKHCLSSDDKYEIVRGRTSYYLIWNKFLLCLTSILKSSWEILKFISTV